MYRNYTDSDRSTSESKIHEEIQILNAISRVSARLARNLAILAASEQSEPEKTEGIENSVIS